jgi:Arc/MetJ-type ribon-helix-helix transcriptional regulator
MSEQIAVRLPADLAVALDEMVRSGRFESKAQAVRVALSALVDAERRSRVGKAIVDGYLALPQDEGDVAAATAAAIRSIHEEPW